MQLADLARDGVHYRIIIAMTVHRLNITVKVKCFNTHIQVSAASQFEISRTEVGS